MTVKELFEYVKEFKTEFNTFKSNDFHGLEAKVDKLSTKVAWIVGIISALSLISNVLLKVLG